MVTCSESNVVYFQIHDKYMIAYKDHKLSRKSV